jgi:hypothetical protein
MRNPKEMSKQTSGRERMANRAFQKRNALSNVASYDGCWNPNEGCISELITMDDPKSPYRLSSGTSFSPKASPI